MWLMATSEGALLAIPLPLSVEIMSPVTKAAAQVKIAESSAVAFYQWFRDICSWKLLQQQIVLGGPNTIVHIDESLFRDTPKVR